MSHANKSKFTKHYGQSAFTTILICLCISVADIAILRQYMDWENRRRDKEQGLKIDPEPRGVSNLAAREGHISQTNIDETDCVNTQFRYYL
jgi:hypothetical protein